VKLCKDGLSINNLVPVLMTTPPAPVFRTIPESAAGGRLDKWLRLEFPEQSRTELQQWIRNNRVTLDGQPVVTPGFRVQAGMTFTVTPPPPSSPDETLPAAEDLPLGILFEDDYLVAVNKAPGQITHPAPGHSGGTLLNAMLHHYPDLRGAGPEDRPGLVHRLDSGTSGVLVFGRTPQALEHLQTQFKSRTVSKTYIALCRGIPSPLRQTVNLPIGRHPVHRQKRAVEGEGARSAVTHFELMRGLAGGTAGEVKVKIETGRTHQIRVHLAHAGHPVLGDDLYGGKRAQPGRPWPPAPRTMLHAARLELSHPHSGQRLVLEAPLPPDMTGYIEQLRSS